MVLLFRGLDMKISLCARPARIAVVALAVSGLVFAGGVGNLQAYFSVSKDSFSISNAPGWCFAMAAFSRWYYLTNQGGPTLREVLDKRAQRRIAKELQRFYSKHLVTLQANYCNRNRGAESVAYRRLHARLLLGEPHLVLLMNKGPRGAVLHAVLAYQWLPERNLLKVYDPNYCNEVRYLDLERGEYTSLNITYHAICFPEVLHNNRSLVRKMQSLFHRYLASKHALTPRVLKMRAR